MSCCNVVPTVAPLDGMIANLKEAFSSEEMPSPDAIKAIMAAYIAAGHKDWREFALFCPHKYARNLLEFNDNFELILLCWLPGQESPIHNHSVRKDSASFLSFSEGPRQFLSPSPALLCTSLASPMR